jgi:hypothetical protein
MDFSRHALRHAASIERKLNAGAAAGIRIIALCLSLAASCSAAISSRNALIAGVRAPRMEKKRSRERVRPRERLVSFFSQRRTTLLHCCLFLRIVDLRARKRAASISERRADGQEKGETGEEKGSEKGQEKVVSPAGLSSRAETASSDIALHGRPERFTAFRAVPSLDTEFPCSASHVPQRLAIALLPSR